MPSKASPEPDPGEVRAQLARLLASDRFAKSRNLSRFLQFTVERALDGKAEELKEYLIATQVFGRKPSFDPREDGIVRVQAVHLRSRVVAYYENEGAADAVVIEYTKGSYAPTFRGRRAEPERSATPSPESIAVLPFLNMSSDPENEYFSDGLTEELISVLANVHGLRVVARTSVFRYKGKAADIREIGAELSAGAILEGSVRKSAGRLCITAQLVDAQSGYQRWSRTYRVEMQDVFSVQQEIATAIASTLKQRDGDAETRRRTPNLAGYHSYLKGRFYLGKWTEEAFRKSIVFFEAAIELDPAFAAAYAGLADAQFVLACYGKTGGRDLLSNALSAACKALEHDPMLAEAHVSLGAVRAIGEWNWESAEREFLMATQLDPNCATAFQWYGVLCLIPQGRLAEAETAIRRARDLDPLSPPINTSLGLVYFVQGRYDEAESCFKRALEIDPGFDLAYWWLGAIYLSRSMLPKAFSALRKAGVLSKSRFHDAGKFAAASGRAQGRGKAERVLRALASHGRRDYASPLLVAAVHASAGLKDDAIEWLRRAIDEHDPWVAWLGVDRRFDLLRDDPRFVAMLDRIGVGNAVAVASASRS